MHDTTETAEHEADNEAGGATTEAGPAGPSPTDGPSPALRARKLARRRAAAGGGGGGGGGAGAATLGDGTGLMPRDPRHQAKAAVSDGGAGGNSAGGASPVAAPVVAGPTGGTPISASFTRSHHAKYEDLVVPGGKFGGTTPSFQLGIGMVRNAAGEEWGKEAGGRWTVTGTIQMDSSWGVAADVDNMKRCNGPDSPILASMSPGQISSVAEDFAPTSSPAGKPKREKYWNREMTVKHEEFHMNDFWQWLQDKGLGYAAKWWATESVSGTFDQAFKQILARKEACADYLKIKWESDQFDGAEDEASKPCEIKCYGAFKGEYQQLSDDIAKKAKST